MGVYSLLGDALSQISSTVTLASTIVLALCAGFITVYAVWIGWQFMKAKDDAKRFDKTSGISASGW